MIKKSLYFIALAIGLCFGQQNQDTVTNETIMKMVAAGVPASAIIQTINSAPRVTFTFLPGDLTALGQARVPEDVVRAMAARANGRSFVTPAVSAPVTPPLPAQTKPAPPPPPTAPPSTGANQVAPPPPPRSFGVDVAGYQGRGTWDVEVQGSGTFAHSGGGKLGLVDGTVGYFVSHGSEVGFTVSGIFLNGAQDVLLGGGYRYYFGNGRARPFLGATAGGNVAHASGVSTQGNAAFAGSGGVRVFVAPRIALDIAYNLVYVHVSGASFSESSESQIAFGFAHTFGGYR